jgi:hypothetical protein
MMVCQLPAPIARGALELVLRLGTDEPGVSSLKIRRGPLYTPATGTLYAQRGGNAPGARDLGAGL